MEAAVHLRGAVSVLGGFPALAGVDLAVAAGEVLLLQGPNGAGKTTLLRLCAGLVPLSAGDGRVLGHDLRTEARAVRRRVGLLGHGAGLYDDLTVADNVAFWARAAGADTGDARAAMARLGLDGRLRDVAVGRLSAGQRRRAAFAVLLARRPEVWLLDEPHAALDADGRDAVDALVRHAAASGVTVVVASHELERAGAIADRSVTVAGGTVVPPSLPAGSAAPARWAGSAGSAGSAGPPTTPGAASREDGAPPGSREVAGVP